MMYFNKLRNRPLLKSFLILNSGVLLAKIIGFIKQPIYLNFLGEKNSDLFISSDKIGQIIVIFFVMGSISSTLIPILSKKENQTILNEIFSVLLFWSLLIIVIFSIVLYSLIDFIIPYFVDDKTLIFLTNSYSEYNKFKLSVSLLLFTSVLFVFQSFLNSFLSVKRSYRYISISGIISGTFIVLFTIMSNGNYLYTVYGVLFGIVISNVLLLKSAIREGLVLFKNFKISLLKKYSSIVNKFLYSSLIRVFIIDPINIALLMIIPIKQYDGQIVSLDIAFTLITAFVFITNSYNTVIFPELSDISKKITS